MFQFFAIWSPIVTSALCLVVKSKLEIKNWIYRTFFHFVDLCYYCVKIHECLIKFLIIKFKFKFGKTTRISWRRHQPTHSLNKSLYSLFQCDLIYLFPWAWRPFVFSVQWFSLFVQMSTVVNFNIVLTHIYQQIYFLDSEFVEI